MISTRTIAEDLIAHVSGRGVAVGDAEEPDGCGWQGAEGASQFGPYAILVDSVGSIYSGPEADTFADVAWQFQFTCVGATGQQARWVADTVTASLIDQSIVFSGDMTLQRVSYNPATGLLSRDDDPPVSLFYSTPRFVIYITS